MSLDAARVSNASSPLEQLRYGRQVMLLESQALSDIAKRLDANFCRAVEFIFHCRGSVIVAGMGKAGLVGQKIAATLASTGTPSHWLHPAEALHGDLGRIHSEDAMLILSQSGETEEIVCLLPILEEMRLPIVAITGRADSPLARAAAAVIDLGPLEEACPLGLAPTTSSTAMLAVGDALALVVSRMRGFSRDDFARLHPAGALGRKLSRVEQHMRPLEQCRVASQEASVREVFVRLSVPGRRTGAIMLVDASDRLSGIFTDSDLARLFEHRRDDELDRPIREVMTSHPVTVRLGSILTEAVAILAQRKISELPVVDAEGKPAGLLDVTDLVGLLPREAVSSETEATEASLPAEGSSRPGYRVFREPEDTRPA